MYEHQIRQILHHTFSPYFPDIVVIHSYTPRFIPPNSIWPDVKRDIGQFSRDFSL